MAPSNTHRAIKKLLKDPFGPYPDFHILDKSSDAPPRDADFRCLTSFQMLCNNEPVGLDDTEFLAPAPSTHPTVLHSVKFFGKLEIDNLLWLSPTGRKWLGEDLRKRGLEKLLQQKPLSLETVYSSGLKITVWIQGEKNMTASFLTSNVLPYGLLLESKCETITSRNNTKGRKYQITSMQAKTLSQSLNFLSRYQLLALMNDLIQKDPENTPVEDRNILYFVIHYITHYVTSPDQPHRFRRHIYDHEVDEDVDVDGYTKKARHPRHVPRAEIVGIFGAQAEWILAEQLLRQSSKRIVDINTWYSFCLEMRAARVSARKDRNKKVPWSRPVQRWGLPDGVDSDADDDSPDIDLSVFGEPPGGWAKRLKNARKGTLANKEKAKNKKAPPSRILSPSLSDPGTIPQGRTTYDSDFSEASSSPASDSDSDSPPNPIDPEIFSSIPPALSKVPSIGNNLIWHCPVRDCSYTIDFVHLTEECVHCLDADQVGFLRGRTWATVRDPRVQRAFAQMVSHHYDEHITFSGIRIRELSTTKVTLEWIHPKRHRPWPPPNEREDDDVDNKATTTPPPIIKEEEQVTHVLRRPSRFAAPSSRNTPSASSSTSTRSLRSRTRLQSTS